MAPHRDLIVVDIESDVPHPRNAVELCQPFLLGLKHFRATDNGVELGEYVHFTGRRIGAGVGALARMRGRIIGYNVFDFDYVVLRSLLTGTGIIERSFDILRYLRRRASSVKGLGLNAVAKAVLGEGKASLSAPAHESWHAGAKRAVLQYNERDCDLTARLWHHLRTAGSVQIGKGKLHFSAADRRQLANGRQFATEEAWTTEFFDIQRLRERSDRLAGIPRNPFDIAAKYDRHTCDKSKRMFFARLAPASEHPSGEDTQSLYCPACGGYLFDSPYRFLMADDAPTNASAMESAWRRLAGHVGQLDITDHLLSEGFPRSQDVMFGSDCVSRTASAFNDWLEVASRDPRLRRYIPRWSDRTSFVHRRTMSALVREAEVPWR